MTAVKTGRSTLITGAVLVGLVVVLALVSFLWTPHDPVKVDATARLLGPTGEHLFGTDKFGRDVASQIMVGARTTLYVGVVAVGVAAVIGTPLGILAGMSRRWLGEFVMRANDLLLAFPALLLAIMLGAVFGASTLTAMIAIGVATVPSFARIARSGTLRVMSSEYVLAARAAGAVAAVHRAQARAPEHRRAADRAVLGVVRDRRAFRSGAVLPRVRHPPADPVVGANAAGVAGTAHRAAAARDRARSRDRDRRARLQPAR